MSEMIERVARAMREGGDARAVIEAMREPTRVMMDAVAYDDIYEGDWSAMIDAALRPSPVRDSIAFTRGLKQVAG